MSRNFIIRWLHNITNVWIYMRARLYFLCTSVCTYLRAYMCVFTYVILYESMRMCTTLYGCVFAHEHHFHPSPPPTHTPPPPKKKRGKRIKKEEHPIGLKWEHWTPSDNDRAGDGCVWKGIITLCQASRPSLSWACTLHCSPPCLSRPVGCAGRRRYLCYFVLFLFF